MYIRFTTHSGQSDLLSINILHGTEGGVIHTNLNITLPNGCSFYKRKLDFKLLLALLSVFVYNSSPPHTHTHTLIIILAPAFSNVFIFIHKLHVADMMIIMSRLFNLTGRHGKADFYDTWGISFVLCLFCFGFFCVLTFFFLVFLPFNLNPYVWILGKMDDGFFLVLSGGGKSWVK